jgi:urease accessory protein
MSAASSPSEPSPQALQTLRVKGGVRAAFRAGPRGTFAATVHEADGWRVRFPDAGAGADCEAVILNTGGGIAGGDEVRLDFDLGPGARVTATSAAGERVYRALDVPARIATALRLAPGSALAWLPRETILSSGARMARRIEVEMAESASLSLLDILVLGRHGSGERMQAGMLDDLWAIRRGGRLVHAEAVRLDGAIADALARPAIAGGAHVIGTLLHVAPEAEACLERVRREIVGLGDVEIAASAWEGKLVLRALAGCGGRMRAAMQVALDALRGAPMPRAWMM